jgi:hypothetical protein
MRSYVSHGVDVEIEETDDEVSLTLAGRPIGVSRVSGGYRSHLASPFMNFASIEELVDYLLATEGELWVLEKGGGPVPPHDHGGHT